MTQPQRHRQTTAERLDQAPMLVWFPEWPEMGELPALPSSPLERRTQRRFPSNNWHLSASVTLLRTSLGQRNASEAPLSRTSGRAERNGIPLSASRFSRQPTKDRPGDQEKEKYLGSEGGVTVRRREPKNSN